MENENRNKTGWLKELAIEESLWEKRAYAEMPAVIAYEYRRLHDMAVEGNVYGTMLQIKDVCEIILKYPMMLGLCILKEDNKPDNAEFYQKIIAKILGKLMSLGDWVDRVKELEGKKIPLIIYNIIRDTRKLFKDTHKIGKDNGITNWRNQAIGHGVLRMEDDADLRLEIRDLFLMLKDYFTQEIFEAYRCCVLLKGDLELIGCEAAEKLSKDNSASFSLKLQAKDGAKTVVLTDLKYIVMVERQIGVFDAYMVKRQSSKYIDYMTGQLEVVPKDFFFELYEKLKRAGMVAAVEDFSREKTSKEIEKLINELDHAQIFVNPKYVYCWFNEKMENNAKGCFMLKMGRGMGKSTLSAYMDGRYNGTKYVEKQIKAPCIIRTYHCSRNQIRDIRDFVMSLNTMFMEMDYQIDRIDDIGGVFKTVSRDVEQGGEAKAVADLLNSCAKELGQKIVLVIDGIDEIIDPRFFAYFPNSEALVDDVYVFYTVRPDSELSDERLRKRIAEVPVDEEPWTVLPENEEHQALVRDYVHKELKKIRGAEVDDEECQRLATQAGYSFLRLLFVMTVRDGQWYNVQRVTANMDEAGLFGDYLSFIERQYGQKFFNLYVLPVLGCFGIFRNGLTFRELSWLSDTDNELMLLAALNDLKGILTIEHTGMGNFYSLANESYVSYVQENYTSYLRQRKQEMIDELLRSAESYDVDFCWNNESFYYNLQSKDKEYATTGEEELHPVQEKAVIKKEFTRELIWRKYILFLLDEDFEERLDAFEIAWAWLLTTARIGKIVDSPHDCEIMSVNFRWVKRVLLEATEKSINEKIAWAWFYYYVYPAVLKIEAADDEAVVSERYVNYYKRLLCHDNFSENELFLMAYTEKEEEPSNRIIRYCKKLLDVRAITDINRFLLMLAQCYRLGKLSRAKSGKYYYTETEEVTVQRGRHTKKYTKEKERENPYQHIFYAYLSFLLVYKNLSIEESRFMEFADNGALLVCISDAVFDIFGENCSTWNAGTKKLMGNISNYFLNKWLNSTKIMDYRLGIKSNPFYYNNIKTTLNQIIQYGEKPHYMPAKYFPKSFQEYGYRSEMSFYELINGMMKGDEEDYYRLICKDYNPFLRSVFYRALRRKNKAMLSYCSEQFEKLIDNLRRFKYDEEKLKLLCDEIASRPLGGEGITRVPFFDYFKKIKFKKESLKEMLAAFKEWIDEFSEVPILRNLYFRQYKNYTDEMVRIGEKESLGDAIFIDKIWKKLMPVRHEDAAFYIAYAARYSFLKGNVKLAEKLAKECIAFIHQIYESDENLDNLPQNKYMDEWAVCHQILANICGFQSKDNAYYIFDRIMPTDAGAKWTKKYILQAASSYFNYIIMAEILEDTGTIEKFVNKLTVFLSEIKSQKMPIENEDDFSEIDCNVQMCIYLFDLRKNWNLSNAKIREIANYIYWNHYHIKLQFVVLFLYYYGCSVSPNEYNSFLDKINYSFDESYIEKYGNPITTYSVAFSNGKVDMDFPSRGWDLYSYPDDRPECNSIFFTVNGFSLSVSYDDNSSSLITDGGTMHVSDGNTSEIEN